MTPVESGRSTPPVEEVMAQLARLDIRHEELHAVSEELRVQREQVSELLVRYEAEQRWRSQLTALVPLGLAVTDGNGELLDVNPALVAAVGVASGRLRGRPLSVFLSPEDAPRFRSALRELVAPGGGQHRLAVTLLPRAGAARPAELFGFTETEGPAAAARVQWVLTPADEEAPRPPVAAAHAADPAAHQPTDVLALASSFAELSALPVEDTDRRRMLGRMATLVRSGVPGADWVSITLGSPQEPDYVGSDSSEAQQLDGLQLRVQEGPCWDAHASGAPVVTADLATDRRWPGLLDVVPESAVRSVMAVPVVDDGQTVGVINVYAAAPDAFGAVDRRLGELAAAAVAGVLQNVAARAALRSLAANLEQALTSRAVIDQAKGVLMARLGVGADDAFARLVTLSSRLNVKLRDLARLVTEGDADLIIAAGG